jgi:hypothetical protein
MPVSSNENLPLTVREATESRLKNMPVKAEVKEALKPGSTLNMTTLSKVAAENLVPAGKETMPTFTIEKGQTFNEQLSQNLYGKSYSEISNEQRYFVVTIETIMIQNGSDVNKVNAGANFYINFKDGSCTDDKESYALNFDQFVKVKAATGEKISGEYDKLLKDGILYKAFMQDKLDSSFAGRVKFLKDNQAVLLPLINKYLKEKGQTELDASKSNFGYGGTEAQNGAYLKAYVDMKLGKMASATAAPKTAPVEAAKPTPAPEKAAVVAPAAAPKVAAPVIATTPTPVEAAKPAPEKIPDMPTKEQIKKELQLKGDVENLTRNGNIGFDLSYRGTKVALDNDLKVRSVKGSRLEIIKVGDPRTADQIIDWIEEANTKAPEKTTTPVEAVKPTPAPVPAPAPKAAPVEVVKSAPEKPELMTKEQIKAELRLKHEVEGEITSEEDPYSKGKKRLLFKYQGIEIIMEEKDAKGIRNVMIYLPDGGVTSYENMPDGSGFTLDEVFEEEGLSKDAPKTAPAATFEPVKNPTPDKKFEPTPLPPEALTPFPTAPNPDPYGLDDEDVPVAPAKTAEAAPTVAPKAVPVAKAVETVKNVKGAPAQASGTVAHIEGEKVEDTAARIKAQFMLREDMSNLKTFHDSYTFDYRGTNVRVSNSLRPALGVKGITPEGKKWEVYYELKDGESVDMILDKYSKPQAEIDPYPDLVITPNEKVEDMDPEDAELFKDTVVPKEPTKNDFE